MLLHGSRGAKLVKRALGHPRKNENHRVHPFFLMFGGHANDAQPVSIELSTKKSIHPVYLQHNVGQAHELAHPILGCIPGVFLKKYTYSYIFQFF